MIQKYYDFFLCLANTGIITKQIALKNFSISKSTFYKFLSENLIIHKGNFIMYGRVTSIYSLSNSSKNVLNSMGKASYKSSISQIEHDYLLLKTYCSLPAYIQHTWLNETELQSLYSGITVDGLFMFDNELYGVEVITPYYSKDIIAKKKSFADKYCKRLITLNTIDIPLK